MTNDNTYEAINRAMHMHFRALVSGQPGPTLLLYLTMLSTSRNPLLMTRDEQKQHNALEFFARYALLTDMVKIGRVFD